MARIAAPLIAAAAIVLGALPASAHESDGEEYSDHRGGESRYRHHGDERERFGRARWEEQRQLLRIEETRDRFFAFWDGSPWARARFDRWYSWRREQIRRRFAWLERERWR